MHRHGGKVIPLVAASGAGARIEGGCLTGADGLVGAERRLRACLDVYGSPTGVGAVIVMPYIEFNRVISRQGITMGRSAQCRNIIGT